MGVALSVFGCLCVFAVSEIVLYGCPGGGLLYGAQCIFRFEFWRCRAGAEVASQRLMGMPDVSVFCHPHELLEGAQI